MTERDTRILEVIVEAVIALVLIAAMTWVVLSPASNDEISKAALVIVASTAGFLFGRHTTARS